MYSLLGHDSSGFSQKRGGGLRQESPTFLLSFLSTIKRDPTVGGTGREEGPTRDHLPRGRDLVCIAALHSHTLSVCCAHSCVQTHNFPACCARSSTHKHSHPECCARNSTHTNNLPACCARSSSHTHSLPACCARSCSYHSAPWGRIFTHRYDILAQLLSVRNVPKIGEIKCNV